MAFEKKSDNHKRIWKNIKKFLAYGKTENFQYIYLAIDEEALNGTMQCNQLVITTSLLA